MKIKGNRARKLIGFLAIFVGWSVLASVALQLRLFSRAENILWDWRMGFVAQYHTPDPKIKIITIDQRSLDYFVKDTLYWPWPRAMYSRVSDFLTKAGAKGVAFDMIFSEPSKEGVSDDQVFADSIRKSIPVIIPLILRNADDALDKERYDLLRGKQRAASVVSNFAQKFLSHKHVAQYYGATLPILEYIESAAALGNVSASPGLDGVIRHIAPGGYIRDTPVLNLPFALYNAVLGEKSVAVRRTLFDEQANLVLRFSGGEGSYPTYRILDVIQSMTNIEQGEKPTLDPEVFKDSWVFVGPTAPALLDLKATPLADKFPGVEVNATALDNILHHDFIKETPYVVGLLLSLIGIFVAAAIAIYILRPFNQLISILLFSALFVAMGCYLAVQGYWIPMMIPLTGMVLTLISALGFQYQLEGREHRFIKNAFKHYVTEGVIDRIVDDPSSLALGGERRELTMLFSDIEGFTSISEKLEASQLVEMLNLFLTEMTDIVLRYNGTLDKYVGDAIVAFWNAPVAIPEHPYLAVQAALECQKRLGELTERFVQEFGVALKIRIGIHTGTVSVGNFGSRDRFNYTIIGDSANLASRLEGANKYFGTYLLISESTKQAVGNRILSRKVADIKVVGRTEAVAVYEPQSAQVDATVSEQWNVFALGLEKYEAGNFAEAIEIFQKLTDDSVARVYLSRAERDLQRYAHDRSAWSSIWSLSEK